LISEINTERNLGFEYAGSKEQAVFALATIIATAAARDGGQKIAASTVDKIRASGMWLIGFVWDAERRLQLTTRAVHNANPQPAKQPVERPDVTSVLTLVGKFRWTASTPNRYISHDLENHRALVLCMIMLGCRFVELWRMSWELCKRVRDFYELECLIKGKGPRRQLLRIHRLSPNSPFCPYAAFDAVRELAMRRQSQPDIASPLRGPVWTAADGTPWSEAQIVSAIQNVLRSAGQPWHNPYGLKHGTADALVQAGMSRSDVAKFIRHSPASVNLDKYYLRDDKGKRATHLLDRLAQEGK
jgi:integrase